MPSANILYRTVSMLSLPNFAQEGFRHRQEGSVKKDFHLLVLRSMLLPERCLHHMNSIRLDVFLTVMTPNTVLFCCPVVLKLG